MNSKLVFVVTAGMLLATSCSKDELNTASSGNEAQVTFSLGLEGHIATRAISDGKSADKLVYAVFDKDGTRISTLNREEKITSFPTTVTLTLAKGQTYKVAFWAQNSECKAYEVNDNMNVTVSYEGVENNDETRDAFFKTTEAFTVTGSTSMDVVLKRPFAQINVGVETDDWDKAVASGIEIEKSTVIIKKAATSIDLVTGAVTAPTNVTYSLAAIPAESENLEVDVDGDGEMETYKWLSMSYILVNDESKNGAEKATLEDLSFTFQPKTGNEITLNDGLNSVPVQRNWRTNILGKLLTGDIEFTIKIDPNYENDHIYPSESAQKLAMAAAYGGEVTLEENVVLSEPLEIAAGKSVIINLNGKTITPPAGKDRTIQVQNGAELVINGDGTIGSLEGYALAVCVKGGKLTINGGTYYGGSQSSCIYLFNSSRYGLPNNGSIEINGGTFKVNAPYNNFYYVLNQQNGATGTITVKGGTFENYNPAGGDDHDQPTCFVAEGYSSVKINDNPATYRVAKKVECNSVADLMAAASSEESQNIVLSQDVQLEQPLTFKGDVVLDGGNNSVNITGRPLSFNGQNTVIKGIKFNNGTAGKESSIYLSDNDTKNLLIEGCEFLNAKWDNIQLTKADESVIIRNCTFKNTEQGYRYIHLEILDKTTGKKLATTNATLEITGCTFENVSTSYCKDSAITICGFYFKNMNITNNRVKGDGAKNLTNSIIYICDGNNLQSLMSIDDINKAFACESE